MAGWGSTKAINTGNNGPRIDEEMDMFSFPKGKWVQVRFIGPLYTIAWAYLNVKKKDGSVSGGFPKICLDYDPSKQEYTRDICPYRKGGVKVTQRFFSNIIIRSEQKRGGSSRRTESESVKKKMLGEKWHIKDMDSDSYTPVKVFSFPAKVFTDIMDIIEASGEELEVNGIENGFDVKIKADPDAKNPADKWKVMKADNNALTKKELNFLIYKLDVSAAQPEKLEVAKTEWGKLKPKLMIRNEAGKFVPFSSKDSAGDDDLEDDDKPKKKAKRKELSLDDDDDEDKPAKKSSKKSSSKNKKRSVDDDDEDEKPAKKSSKKKVVEKGKGKPSAKSNKADKAKGKSSKKTSKKGNTIDDDDIPF